MICGCVMCVVLKALTSETREKHDTKTKATGVTH